MSVSFKLKSHPDKLLINHLKNVGKLSEKIVKSKFIPNREILSEVSYLIGVAHDFAKATTYFQNWLEKRERTEKANHGILSSLFGYYLVKNYLSEKCKTVEFQHLSAIAWIVIKRHHGNIQNVRWNELSAEIDSLDYYKDVIRKQVKDILENNLGEVKQIYKKLAIKYSVEKFLSEILDKEELYEELKNLLKKICRKKDLKNFFDTLFLYSVLLDADKLDASETEIPPRIEEIDKSIVERYKEKKFGGDKSIIDKVREKAYREVIANLDKIELTGERIFSINLPTGMGKTLTGLSFSLGLREKIKKQMGFTPKIIYSLPFLSIIDQNSQVIEEIFKNGKYYEKIPSNLFLKHHHLADVLYVEEKDGELNPIMNLNRSLLLMEGWHAEIVITTFVQFFHSLITNRNRAARKFHNIVNSIIILDEIQSIPHKYWLLIEEALKYLSREFNSWVILMTATQPLLFREGNEKMKELIEDRKQYFKIFDRVDFYFDLNEEGEFREKEFDLFKEEIYREIMKNKDLDFMIILNTIHSCKELFEHLKRKFAENHNFNSNSLLDEDGICNFPDVLLINLSTNILPSFRLKRIERIKSDDKRKVIVTTQLVEAGVDISVDVIYRDLAPLDCIIQSAGRCNRNNQKKKGKVYVIILKNGNEKFYRYIYDSFLIDATREVIKQFGRKTSEKNFVFKAAETYYNLIKERGSTLESRNILDNIRKLNFADVSKFKLIEEKLPTISIFIEIDNEAEEIRKEIVKVFSLEKGFKKREKLLKMRKSINEHTISIRYSRKTEAIESLPFLEGEFFRYVPREELNKWYKLDTGFYISEEDVKII